MKLRGEEESLERRREKGGVLTSLGIFFLGSFPLPPVP